MMEAVICGMALNLFHIDQEFFSEKWLFLFFYLFFFWRCPTFLQKRLQIYEYIRDKEINRHMKKPTVYRLESIDNKEICSKYRQL